MEGSKRRPQANHSLSFARPPDRTRRLVQNFVAAPPTPNGKYQTEPFEGGSGGLTDATLRTKTINSFNRLRKHRIASPPALPARGVDTFLAATPTPRRIL